MKFPLIIASDTLFLFAHVGGEIDKFSPYDWWWSEMKVRKREREMSLMIIKEGKDKQHQMVIKYIFSRAHHSVKITGVTGRRRATANESLRETQIVRKIDNEFIVCQFLSEFTTPTYLWTFFPCCCCSNKFLRSTRKLRVRFFLVRSRRLAERTSEN